MSPHTPPNDSSRFTSVEWETAELPTVPQSAPPSEPQKIGRFTIVQRLGVGGMAEVFLARMEGPQGFSKTVALKLMNASTVESESARALLVDEARIGGTLHHPNIVEVLDFGEHEGRPWISMEFVEGWTLHHLIEFCRKRKLTLPLSVVIDLFLQVCDGLYFAHTALNDQGVPHKLVHRDIKPDNIIVSRRGVAKIMDFGVVKAATNAHKTLQADTVRGTVLYMSPEQTRGQPLDARSDIFSLGVTLYATIMGHTPFEAQSVPEMMLAIAKCDRTSALAALTEHALILTPIFMRATEPDREARYADVESMRQELFQTMTRVSGEGTLAQWIGLHETALESPDAVAVPPTGTLSVRTGELRTGDVVFMPASEIQRAPVAQKFVPPTRPQRKRKGAHKPSSRSFVARMSSHHRTLALSAIASVVAIVMVLVLGSSTKKTPAPQTEPMNVPAHGQNVLLPPTTVNTGAAKTQHTPAELPMREISPAKTQTPAPREQTRATQPEVKQPENKMTPEETPLESPATPAVVGTGYVTISARPFASIAIDSEERGTTPKQRLPVSAGAHTIVLSCTVCTPPTQETRQITVQAGAEEKVIVYFKE